MKKRLSEYASTIVGGGPAGLAVLLSAHRDGVLRDLLRRGLLILERSARFGSGQISDYVINSDSTGLTFLDPLHGSPEPELRCILRSPVAKRIASIAEGAVPLQDVGELMGLIGDAMRAIIREYPVSAVLTGCSAQSAKSLGNGGWEIKVIDSSGAVQRYQTRRLLLATGASQPSGRLETERVAGVRVAERWGQRLIQSGQVLCQGGLENVAEMLRDKLNPRIAILGGSTSAVAVAHALLNRLHGVTFQRGGVTIFHRKPLRVYYTSAEEAVADGYNDFGPDDLCPVTNRLYRFAGLRLDSRELLMQVCGIGGRAPEPRIALHHLGSHYDEAVRSIDAADLVVAAFGYRPNALPLFNRYNRSIPLFAHTDCSASLVDDRCRVLKADGRPVPGVYGIGLAAGYRPGEKFGGEPSFTGQVNGLWLWQNGIGSIIANALLAPPSKPYCVSGRQPLMKHPVPECPDIGFAIAGAA